ncbi:MAG TPA: glycosyl transferase family 2 [Anaerolineae bacterium]|nr:glycosyl transferase family 2 [Anaerolineae bacterium]
MKTSPSDFRKYNIAVVIPCYRVEREIGSVIKNLPRYVRHIIVVDDASPDGTAELVTKEVKRDPRVILLKHKKNMGVGGAMITGYQHALELDAQIVVKIDGDGQMDTTYLADLLTPLIQGEADYAKGNRFRDFQALQKMPFVRRVGNLGLGFLSKAAIGYWNLFDPTNGYVAINARVLAQLPLDKLDRSYFFETSMLSHLYLLGAVVRDIPMPARYLGERSNLSIRKTLLEFPLKLTRTFFRRIVLKYFIYEFSMASIYTLAGIPLFLFGIIFGIVKWIDYASRNVPAPTGTVMLPTLSVLVGIQFLIAAIEIDLRSTPREPLSPPF